LRVRLAIGMSLWAPNLFSGIRVKKFSDDWTHATVELHVNVITRNYVKTAFGGSLSGQHTAPGLEHLDLPARVPHDVVTAELVHHEHEEVRVGHRRQSSLPAASRSA
jgi:hypothetical protein